MLKKPVYSKNDTHWRRWLFPVLGILSLIWFLIRVIPKPSRALYPCQRAAFPLASGFVIWLAGILMSVISIKKAKYCFTKSSYGVGVICVVIAVAAAWVALTGSNENIARADDPVPNVPLGAAQGIHPGRVVWIHDPAATDWQGPGANDGYSWQPEHTKQHFVNDMMSQALQRLAGEPNDADAWDALFRYFNQQKGKGDAGYQPGEKLAIKVNLTTCNIVHTGYSVNPDTYEKIGYLDKSDTSPQMIVALLGQLVHGAGVNQADITLGDPTTYFPSQWWDICHGEFPEVNFIDHEGRFGRVKAEFSPVKQHWSHGLDPNQFTPDYVPRCYAEADYLINLAVLKGHGAGVTLCAKNHYGSYIRLPDDAGYYNLHDSLAGTKPEDGSYRALVDIMGHPEVGGKTLLYMLDGLYGGYYWQGTPYLFEMQPFNHDWPSSLFVSQDPVAIDSVGLDFLWEEWPDVVRKGGVEDYLKEAALIADPCSATIYDPAGDGQRLSSLGVYERWNNPMAKQYSRNLGVGNGIELISHRILNHSPEVEAWSDREVVFLGYPIVVNGFISDDGNGDPPGVLVTNWKMKSGPGGVFFSEPNAAETVVSFDKAGAYEIELSADDGELTGYSELKIKVYEVGDFNTDGSVDIGDLVMFSKYWLSNELWYDLAPFPVGDGVVNGGDFAEFARRWWK